MLSTHKVGGTNIASYQYSVNSIGQRTAVNASGSAFGTEADWNWDYNDHGELVSAQHTHTSASSRHYDFDSIGNRTEHREGTYTGSGGTATVVYTPDSVNQYAAIDNLTAAPTYDTDGNMTSGPIPNAPTALATLAWDGENRQLSVTPNGGNTTSYVRDAMGRRVMKSITVSSVTTKTYFFYDGWNLIAEYSDGVSGLALERTHAWGTDLSGSAQGAGGVGGLLATCINSASGAPTYYPTYDGNGNVTEYLDGSGAVQSHYEYDPFGNDITPAGTAGSLHNSFPFRFSTKYLDAESGQYHYIGRDYNQSLGRWNNHDPIEEQGGLNMYGFVSNEPISTIDFLGEYGRDVHGFFTYFAVLVAGGSVHDARTAGAYTWGPDVSRKNSATGVIATDILNTFDIQVNQHALSGGSATQLRHDLLRRIPTKAQGVEAFGMWSHVFQDAYAHVKLKHGALTWLLRLLGSKAEYKRDESGTLYNRGLGHFLDGHIPDNVSTSPALFLDMAGTYYSVVKTHYGSSMTVSKFNQYASAIASVKDSMREDFIKYVVRRCGYGKSDPYFDSFLGANLPRLGLDLRSGEYKLPEGDSKPDWERVREWVKLQKW